MMALPSYTINYYSGSTVYTLPAGMVQNIVWNTGRQNITDNWNGGSCTIYGRLPASFSPAPEIGKGVQIKINDGTEGRVWGYISDFKINYGILTAYDTWQLSVESGYSAAARRTSDDVFANAAASTYDLGYRINQASVLAGTGYAISVAAASTFGTTTSSKSWDGYLSDPITECLTTESGVLVDEAELPGGSAFYPTSKIYGHNAPWTNVATFSDANDSNYRFNEIEFRSSAYNYGTEVRVIAAGFATQTSGSGIFTQTFYTINGSAANAADLAAYLKTKLDLSTTVPYSIRFTSSANASKSLSIAALCDTRKVGNYIDVTFRGTTYTCVIEGLTASATDDDITCTYYLSSSLQNAFLRLNDSVFGKLDTNKLGF